MDTAYADDILLKLRALQAHGHTFFDKLSNTLDHPYDAEEARKDKEQLLKLLSEMEMQLKSGLLLNLEENTPEMEGLAMQDRFKAMDLHSRQQHTERERLTRNAKAFEKRFLPSS
ncbi:hypothetical protein QOT17_012641 [Balamuthia mandrillaris]